MQLWRKRVFKALVSGFRQGYRPLEGTAVEAKELGDRVVLPAQVSAEGEEQARLIDGKLRSGQLPVEEWGLDDGKEVQ